MKQHPIHEGYMPYLGYQTYYRIVGEPSNKPALLCLHGGPGSTHNYFEVLDRIALRVYPQQPLGGLQGRPPHLFCRAD